MISDPNDPIYQQLDAWATRSLLRSLPQLRPYSTAMMRGLLLEVVAEGSSSDAAIAQGWLDAIDRQGLRTRGDIRANTALSGSSTSYLLALGPGISLNFLQDGKLGLSGRLSALAVKGQVYDVTPFGSGYDRDVGFSSGATLTGSTQVLQDFNSSMSYGTGSLGFRAGYTRGSWGPIFDDGVVLGPQAPGAGQFSFSWRGQGLSADIGFYMLQQGFTDDVTRTAPGGDLVGLDGEKYLMLHGINWSPATWLTLGLFESVVWVNRIEPLYFLPLSEFFSSQSLSSFGDNSFAGLSGSIYLPQNMRLDGVAYADDLDFSGILHGNFDTKWKLAIQGALSWAPPSSRLQRLSLDYTAVGPYTYTHEAEAAGTNYYGAMAYTNAGQNIGPALDPNSDRFTLKATSVPSQGFRASGILRLIRHGNASAGVAGFDSSTSVTGNASGNLGDPGEWVSGGPTHYIFQGSYDTGTSPRMFRFLTQDVIETSYQAGATLAWSRPFKGLGDIDAGASYLFEYIANAEKSGIGPVKGNTRVRQYMQVTIGVGF